MNTDKLIETPQMIPGSWGYNFRTYDKGKRQKLPMAIWNNGSILAFWVQIKTL